MNKNTKNTNATKSIETAKNALAIETKKPTTKTNATKTDVIFSFRGDNSIGTTIVKKYGLKQYTNKSHDATQLILGGKSSLNLRKVTCFVNATNIDYEILKKCNKYECVENANSVDAIRPHKVYFKFDELENVCKQLATNKFNLNGFEIV